MGNHSIAMKFSLALAVLAASSFATEAETE